ncbi:acetyltransferase (GNAT) family protein [Natranaerovirga hydrolytica]|uniref:Acetyltransferase (GNAT) family protein n=1 Tax=Natranaerovirga hydrolytica TaxID=680378 RepID=A0A4R1MKV0_9FIRM|nr:GNAT family N-acetyltransferase [Natranaerovirga hydrolytica]TCK92680.1 acetyltransferase (GNAT) family protein [Natranaerovirga hydrolytica]
MIIRIEELSMNAWPSLQTHLYDGWILRFSQGYTKRANSINPIYSSDANIEEKIKNCEKTYLTKGLPIIYKLTKACYPKNLDKILESKGYKKIDETSVQILNITEDYSLEKVSGLDIEYEFTQDWINSFVECSNTQNESTIGIMTQMLKNIIGDKICVKMKLDNQIVGCGFGVIEENYMGIFDIIVREEDRGQGIGKAIMQEILKEAQKRNVCKAYLQVVVGNSVAESLYNKLGFREKYRYWYRIKNSSI